MSKKWIKLVVEVIDERYISAYEISPRETSPTCSCLLVVYARELGAPAPRLHVDRGEPPKDNLNTLGVWENRRHAFLPNWWLPNPWLSGCLGVPGFDNASAKAPGHGLCQDLRKDGSNRLVIYDCCADLRATLYTYVQSLRDIARISLRSIRIRSPD